MTTLPRPREAASIPSLTYNVSGLVARLTWRKDEGLVWRMKGAETITPERSLSVSRSGGGWSPRVQNPRERAPPCLSA